MRFVDLAGRLSWFRGQRVHVGPAAEAARAVSVLADSGFVVRALQGRAMKGDALWDELAHGLALPDWFGRNLDALHDALGEAWAGPGRVAVVWHDADQVLARDAQAFLDVLRVLDNAAADAGTLAEGAEPAQVEIVLLGSSPGFSPLAEEPGPESPD